MEDDLLEVNVSDEIQETAVAERKPDAVSQGETAQSVFSTAFSSEVDKAKLDVLNEAKQTDTRFVEEFKEKLKDATLKLAEVEKSKAEAQDAYAQLAHKNVQYEKELVETKQKLNEYQQIEDKWNNKQRSREFHYNGVKDVMLCIGIKNPMCIPLLYALFPVALVFFLIKCTVTATFGNLLCGAVDGNRSKAMKGFFWTILGLFTAAVLALVVYLVVNWVIL